MMTADEERDLLEHAQRGFGRAAKLAETDALQSIALSFATAGEAITRGLLLELKETD